MRPLGGLLALIVICHWSLPAHGFDWSGRIDQLADDLRHPDPAVRRQTLERLGTYPADQIAEYLLPALEDEDSEVRLTAARILGRGRVRRAVPALSGWLTEQDEDMREAACEALGNIGDPRAVAPLARVTSDAAAGVRRAAVEALSAIGTPEVVLPIIGRLNDSHPRVRQAAAEGLGQLSSREAVVPLVSRLQDPVRSVRLAVIGALARIGDPRAASAMVQSLRDTSPEVRSAALSALARLGADDALVPAMGMLHDENEEVQVRAVAVLGAIGNERAIEALIGCLGDSTLSRPALDALVEVGSPAVPGLCEVLRQSSNQLARASALRALVTIGDTAAADTIIEQLETGGGLPEDTLVLALGDIVTERGLMPLLERLDHDSPPVRIAALVALAGHLEPGSPEPAAGEALLARLDAEAAQERLLALLLLARIGEPRVVERASEILASGERSLEEAEQLLPLIASRSVGGLAEEVGAAVATGWPERTAAIRALGASGREAAAEPLLALLTDRHAALRHEAARALGRLGGERVVAALTERLASPEPVDRAALILALGDALARSPSAPARIALERLLSEGETSLALRAADALARAGDVEAAPAVAELLRRPEVVLRRKAADVLGELPSPPAREALIRALDDDDPLVRGLAIWSLGKIGGPEVREILIEALSDSSWAASINAAGALVRLADPTTAEPVCAALAEDQTSPHRWANLLLAAGATGAECAWTAATEAFRRTERPLVRAAAARVIGLLGRQATDEARSAEASALLRSCRAEAPNRRVRDTCDQALEATEPTGEAARGGDWIEFYLYAADGRRLRPRGRFLLVLPDGVIKAGVTDANGFAREAPVPPGVYHVEEPTSGLRTVP